MKEQDGGIVSAAGACHTVQVTVGIDRGHEVSHLLSHHHLCQRNIDMDKIRGSLSKLKKKFKQRRTGSQRESGSDAHRESVDQAGPPPRAESPVVAGHYHDRDGNGANPDGRRPQQPDEPESMPAHGSGNIDGRVVNYSHSHPDVEVTVGSGPSQDRNDPGGQEVERVYPSPSAPSIPHSGTPDSM